MAKQIISTDSSFVNYMPDEADSTTLNTNTKYTLQQQQYSYTNYKKASWKQYTEDTEAAFSLTTTPTKPYTANNILTNIILQAGEHHIPKGKMHNTMQVFARTHQTKKSH